MRERTASVVWRVNENALHLSCKFLFQCLQGEQIVTEDKSVIEAIRLTHSMLGVVAFVWVFKKNARL
jgi:hypothetical protein